MNFRREELAFRAQHAVEWLLTALAERRVVPAFVEDYARAQQRKELLESATRYRELVLMLTRECLLAISVRLCAELPRRITGRKDAVASRGEAAALETFREEYFLHLANTMLWTPGELEEFYGDFELYQMIQAREAAGAKGKKSVRGKSRPRVSGVGGPFADRAALLLDPSLMEKARAAAAKFAPSLEALAEKALAAAFRPPQPSSARS